MNSRSGLALAPTTNVSGVLPLTLVILAGLPIFALGFGSLVAAWMTPEYSHGPLIPLVSLYLFLRELRQAPPAPPGERLRRGPGIAVIALGILLGYFGALAHIPDIVCYAFIIWVMGVVLLSFGWDRGKRHWAPVLHLVFMLPLPQLLYWKLTIFLQLVSSEIGVWVIQMMGIPVFLEGNIIDLGILKLQVAEACSGLQYLFPILSFSYLFSILYRGPMWHKAVLLLLAVPLTVLMNSFRIGMIGVLVTHYGPGQAEGFMHFFEGWIIFGACIGLLCIAAIALQRLTPNPLPLRDAIDVDFDGMGRQAQRYFDVAPSRGLVAGAALSVTALCLIALAPSRTGGTPYHDPFVLFPDRLGDYASYDLPLEEDVAEVLGATDYMNRIYQSRSGVEQVAMFTAFYENQTEGDGIHSPEVCLPNGGWEVFSIEPHEVSFPGTAYGTFTLNRAVIESGMTRQMVYYWFEQRGQRMTNDVLAKFSVIRDGLTRGRTDGALVRFSTPIAPDESFEDADRRILGLMAEALKTLPRYIPE